MRRIHFVVAASALALPFSVQAQRVPTAFGAEITEAPTIDGRLDESVWARADVLSDFVQREPTEGQPISERTEVRIAYDAEALYIGAWMYDRDPSSIVFGTTLRDASLNDADAFLLVLDTYRDGQNGFVFGTTPAGIEFDGQVSNEGQGGGGGGGRQQRGSGGGFNLNWDGSWEVATTTDAEGWYAEMRIPFSTLRYGAGGPQTWGLNFERKIRRNNEESVWAPVPRQFNLYRVSLAGTLSLQAPAKRVMTISPYVLGSAFKDYTVPTVGQEWDNSGGIGGDAKIGINQSLTLDLTVKTDFAQAEVDDQQINLTRFSLFFPEKRAFFLENAGTFAVGTSRSAELFFSRRIGLVGGNEVPILAGARMTGKVGGFQVGLLDIQTDDLFLPDQVTQLPEEISPRNNFAVVRVFREYENRTRLGGIFVSRLNTGATDDYNLTYGLDGRLGVGEALTFNGWVGLTTTPAPTGQPDARTGFNNGEYGFASGANYVTGNWTLTAGYRQIGDDFNPEVGFVNRRDYRHVNARVQQNIRTESVSWFREFRPHISYNQFFSLGGFSEEYKVHVDNHFQFENGAFFQLPGLDFTGEGLEEPFEIRPGMFIPAGSYNNLDWEFRANTNRSAPLSFSMGWNWGGFYTGTRFGPNATLAYRYRDRFSTSLRMNYFDVRLNDVDEFTTSVWRLNASYTFTPRVYVQANVQYNDDTEDLSTNVRFGWLDTAGTGLFIVLNDTEYLPTLALFGSAAGRPSPLQRQVVIKYTKLFNITR